ncbi:hypothetical protein CPB83DRAFT_795108 [Crepidotus variabilis]|uniref:Response regulatory domain-containing protein n=1 Tax=Crepidotus variabilis TaxID=179855 RepID=A0A9P6EC11_9AGAR|nr:hypothetical protein CPB83DRAFT_795108 [Crepidotus variabilis]
MTAPKLPALRLTAEGDCVIEEGVSLDLPPNNKFSISYAPNGTRQNSSSSTGSVSSPKDGSSMASSFSSEPTELMDDQEVGQAPEEDGEGQDANIHEQAFSSTFTSTAPSGYPNGRMSSIPEKPVPQFSRTLSMPLPSHLHHLQNPHRPSPLNSSRSSPRVPLAHSSQVNEVSVELADSIQLVIQTMLQISPPQVLDPAKELFSACALSVPTSSMSAMFTAMKNINYISANMTAFCNDSLVDHGLAKTDHIEDQTEFDVGEVVQCLGDALSGFAAQAGVDLVIYHGDTSLKHAYVSGDESGVSFALSHIVRQILNTTERGDTIELGLLVGSISDPSSAPQTRPPKENDLAIHPLDSNGPIRVTIRIAHKFAASDAQHNPGQSAGSPKPEVRHKPTFSTLILRRILRQIGGSLITDLPPPESFASGRTCDLELILDRAPTPIPPPTELQDEESSEPSLESLASFGDSLKGKRVTLYASAKGSFAHHLTSYLTAWGMDVTHVSPDGQVDGTPEHSILVGQLNGRQDETASSGTVHADQRYASQDSPQLIFIDDDVDILKDRLLAARFENQPPVAALGPRKRPSLSSNHRPRSSPQMARLINFTVKPPVPAVFLHFTSLANYKTVKDVMQSITASYAATSTPLPEVMIIPKPAGPRRFLTALHTAITKPTVDPFFMPIAISSMSPYGTLQLPTLASPISEVSGQSGLPGGQVNSQVTPSPMQIQASLMKNGNRPNSSRTNSDRSTKSFDGPSLPQSNQPPQPSPLAIPDNVEYFSTAAAQKLGTSPSSGLVIQSPDGQTTGIYFHPRNRGSSRSSSNHSVERERSPIGLAASRRLSTSRNPSGNKKEDTVTFSSLYGTTPGGTGTPDTKQSVSSSISQTPTQANVSISPVISPSSHKIIPAPLPDESRPSTSTTIRPSVSSKTSDETRKIASPQTPSEGTGTSTPSRRGLTKRPTADNKETTPAASKQKGKSAASDGNVVPPISVLIVDDNPINQTILSTFMRRKKIKYDLASNGQEAVQKWRSGGFHLILMDIQMPIMDGIQATKEIRRLEQSNAESGYPPISPAREEVRTPSEVSAASSTTGASEAKTLNSPYRSSVIIVALTASSLQADRVAALAAGCNDFLTKPVSLLWLNNKIIEWGSIKALQMWADIRPEAARSLAVDQAQQARNVADRLQVPKSKQPSPTRRSKSIMDENAAALALASSAGPVTIPSLSPTTSSFNIPDRPSSTSSSSTPSGSTAQPNGVSNPIKPETTEPSLAPVDAHLKHYNSHPDTPKPTQALNIDLSQIPDPQTLPLPDHTRETDDSSSSTSDSTKTREGESTDSEDHSENTNTDLQRSVPPGSHNLLPP